MKVHQYRYIVFLFIAIYSSPVFGIGGGVCGYLEPSYENICNQLEEGFDTFKGFAGSNMLYEDGNCGRRTCTVTLGGGEVSDEYLAKTACSKWSLDNGRGYKIISSSLVRKAWQKPVSDYLVRANCIYDRSHEAGSDFWPKHSRETLSLWLAESMKTKKLLTTVKPLVEELDDALNMRVAQLVAGIFDITMKSDFYTSKSIDFEELIRATEGLRLYKESRQHSFINKESIISETRIFLKKQKVQDFPTVEEP